MADSDVKVIKKEVRIMVRNCHKCGLELVKPSEQKVIEFGGDYRVLCPTCYDMTLDFCTPAYVPDISKTRYELIKYKAQKKNSEKSPYLQFVGEVKHLRDKGFTVPEIAQEYGVSNRIIMEVLK